MLERNSRCIHEGTKIRQEYCLSCPNRGKPYSVYFCEIHKECTEIPRNSLIENCKFCEDYNSVIVKWSYGVTTVPSRITLLLETLKSLELAGFPNPKIFVDGSDPTLTYDNLGLDITYRRNCLGVVGNWILSAWELYLSNPAQHYYAIFQDDIVLCKNVREYIEKNPPPKEGYYNLFSFMKDNEKLLNESNYGQWLQSSQWGRGAVALVFTRDSLTKLLSTTSLVNKPQNAKLGTRRIDGAITTALSPRHNQSRSHYEYIHNPSLVQHIGLVSSIGNHNQPIARSFPGKDFDCLSLLSKKELNNGS